MENKTLKAVIEVFGTSAQVAFSEVRPTDSADSLGLDSLDMIEIALDLEEAFPGVGLGTYEPETKATIQEIADYIDKTKAGI